MRMPEPDQAALAKREQIVAALRAIVPGEGVIASADELRAYECDGLSAYRSVPMAVFLPSTTEAGRGDPEAVRCASASRSCRAVPAPRSRAARCRSPTASCWASASSTGSCEVDFENRCVVVQPGVTNLGITAAVEHEGFYYAPDPSSQIACTIGGNVAENSGGVHCLKYGLTTNNLLGLEIVLPNGDVVRLGGKHLDAEAYDLLGLMTGSEGLLGVVTEVTVRILRKPETAQALLIGFPTNEQAGNCVAAIIGAGIIPGGLEMMDRPAIHAAEDFCHPGYPLDVEGLLICELDGPAAEVLHLIEVVGAIARQCGATTVRVSSDEAERQRFWAGRKAAFPAVGKISPDYYCMDGTIPRHQLPLVLARMREMSEKYGLRVANVFHAGDGNLHPLILYDANQPGELERTEEFGAAILKLCVEVGGVLTGEHGVGVEKRDLMPVMFNEDDLNQQQRVKCAFDPTQILNPGKVFPKLHRCAELGRMHIHRGQLPHPDLPRF